MAGEYLFSALAHCEILRCAENDARYTDDAEITGCRGRGTYNTKGDTRMDAVVAVYSDWGIGASGTQPVVLKADRAHFRQLTDGAAVIVGRKTLEDFPGGKPLKNRHNIVVTRQNIEVDGAQVAHNVQEGLALAANYDRSFVIGGASVFNEYFPHLSRVFVTFLDVAPHSDVFFPNLDDAPDWTQSEAGEWQQEDGVRFRFCTYEKIK